MGAQFLQLAGAAPGLPRGEPLRLTQAFRQVAGGYRNAGGAGAQPRRARAEAAMVASISTSPCAALTKPAS